MQMLRLPGEFAFRAMYRESDFGLLYTVSHLNMASQGTYKIS